MSEYIVNLPNLEGDLYFPDERHGPMVATPVVRCMDCKFVYEDHYGAWGRTWYCERFGMVESDGFCACGERKAVEHEKD